MPKQLQKCLKLSGDQDSYLFHTFSVHTEIAVAYAGSRTKVNCLRGFIEAKLHVIDKAEQQAGELVVEIGLVFIDELAPRQCCEHRFQRLLRFRARFPVLERCDSVVFIGRLSRHAIRTGWARRKRPWVHSVRLYALLWLATSDFMAAGSEAHKYERWALSLQAQQINTDHPCSVDLSDNSSQLSLSLLVFLGI